MPIDYIAIGDRIRTIRTAKHMTQAFLAEQSGVEPSNISHIERAATKVSLPTLIRLANALGVSLDELVSGSLIKSRHIAVKEIDELFSDCTPAETRALLDVLRITKTVLRRQDRNKD